MKSGDWPGGGGKGGWGVFGVFLAGVSFGRIHVAEVSVHLTTGYYGILLVQSDVEDAILYITSSVYRLYMRCLRLPSP